MPAVEIRNNPSSGGSYKRKLIVVGPRLNHGALKDISLISRGSEHSIEKERLSSPVRKIWPVAYLSVLSYLHGRVGKEHASTSNNGETNSDP